MDWIVFLLIINVLVGKDRDFLADIDLPRSANTSKRLTFPDTILIYFRKFGDGTIEKLANVLQRNNSSA